MFRHSKAIAAFQTLVIESTCLNPSSDPTRKRPKRKICHDVGMPEECRLRFSVADHSLDHRQDMRDTWTTFSLEKPDQHEPLG
jgi:hypothetical protein